MAFTQRKRPFHPFNPRQKRKGRPNSRVRARLGRFSRESAVNKKTAVSPADLQFFPGMVQFIEAFHSAPLTMVV
jgi:hypothetical protein